MKKFLTLIYIAILVLNLVSCESGRTIKEIKTPVPIPVQTAQPIHTLTPAPKILNDQNKKNLEDMNSKAFSLFLEGKYKEVIEIEDSVLKEDPNNYKAYNIKGIALCYSNQFKEGMKLIDTSIEINKEFAYSRFNKALAYELHGYYDEALKWYNKTIEIDKNNTWSYYGISTIYGRKGDVLNTVKYLKIAILLDDTVKKVAKDEHDFNNVKNSKEFIELIK